jgi:streptogramin lyase
MRTRNISHALVLLALTACSSGGTSSLAPAVHSGGNSTGQAVLRIVVPAITGSALAHKHPLFVASGTAGVLIQTYLQSDTNHANLLGSTATDISSGSAACSGTTGTPRTCSVAFAAPPGPDQFVVTSYDAAPVSGSFTGANQLGAAVANQTITSGTTNAINVTIDGVVASISVSAAYQSIRGTAPSSQTIVVNGLDADGNIILTDAYVNASGNAAPITLALSPNTGNVFTLGTTTLSAASPTGVNLAYSGTAAAAFTTTLTATAGSLHGSLAIALLGPSLAQYNTTTSSAAPSMIANAPYSFYPLNNTMWFTEVAVNKVASITPSGTVTEFSLIGTGPVSIATSPLGDEYLYIAESTSSSIDVIASDGSEHADVLTLTPAATPWGITYGPAVGTVWITEAGAAQIGVMNTNTDTMTFEYPTGLTSSAPFGITTGSDGNMWFADLGANDIGKITPAGVVTGYPIPTAASGDRNITPGPDGNLWFTETSTNKIGKITTGGTISEYTIPTAASQPTGIVAGADGNIWFVESATQKLGRITTSGTITEYTVAATGSLDGIATGPDNNLWFVENSASKIGVFSW